MNFPENDNLGSKWKVSKFSRNLAYQNTEKDHREDAPHISRLTPYQINLGRSRKKQAEMYKSEINGISQAQVYHYDDEEMKRKGSFDKHLWCLNIFQDLIYEKRIQTLNLQRNLRKIRLQKEEISSRKFQVKSNVSQKYIKYLGVKPIKGEKEGYDGQESDSREEKEEVRKLNFFRSKSIM